VCASLITARHMPSITDVLVDTMTVLLYAQSFDSFGCTQTAGCTVIMQRGLDDYRARDRHAAQSEGHGVGAAASSRYNLLCSLRHNTSHMSHVTYHDVAASTHNVASRHTCAGYVHEACNPRKDSVTSIQQVQVWQPCKKEQGCWGWGWG